MTNYRVIMEWVHDEKIKYLEKRKIEESASQDVLFLLVCAGHGMSSVGDKPTTGSYRQVQ